MGYTRKSKYQMYIDSFDRAAEQNISTEKISNELFIVYNHDHNSNYIVNVENGEIMSCECPHHFYRGVVCKHMVVVMQRFDIPIAELILENV